MIPKPIIGLFGVVLGVSFTELNDQVVSIALTDISGGLGIDTDAASWIRSLYVTGLILGMCVSPSLGLAFSNRRFILFSIAMSCTLSLLIPLSNALPLLYTLRFLAGMGEGFIIATLIGVALKVLPPPIRLYGLALYAMTATFIPTIAPSMAALWVDAVGDWRYVFWQDIPVAAASALLVWYGMDQDPPQFERLKKFDWRGALLVAIGFGSLSTVLQQGERLDWFNSTGLSTLSLVAAMAIPLFLWNETRAEVPLIKLELLKRRNYAYGLICLVTFLMIGLSATQVPLTFLQEVQHYRPMQSQLITLEIAVAQLALLPATAWLLDFEWADPRIVSAVGFIFILAACVGGAFINRAWTPRQFISLQALQAIGQPMVVLSLLMMATNELKPEDAPFGSALVNTPRAIAEALGFGLLSLITRWRAPLHRSRILDTLGQNRISLMQTHAIPTGPLEVTDGQGPVGAGLQSFNSILQEQVTVLTTIDTYVILAGLVVFMLLVLAIVPVRTYSPRILAAKAKH